MGPGWTLATGIDDYVTRWVPSVPGLYDVVAIEPMFGGPGTPHDDVTEIDAIMAWVPEPSSMAMAGLGAVGIIAAAWRRARRCSLTASSATFSRILRSQFDSSATSATFLHQIDIAVSLDHLQGFESPAIAAPKETSTAGGIVKRAMRRADQV